MGANGPDRQISNDPHDCLQYTQAQPQMPLSKRMRISIKGAHPSGAATPAALQEGEAHAAISRADIDLLVYILDWIGALCCFLAAACMLHVAAERESARCRTARAQLPGCMRAGVVSLWCCTVALFLAFLRKPLQCQLAAWRQPSLTPKALMHTLLPSGSGSRDD